MEGIRWAFNFRAWSPLKDDWMMCLSLIQKEEKERISKFVFRKDAKASISGRLMIRKVISQKLNLPWSSFCLKRTDKGRPYLEENQTFDFNVSHDGHWVILAAEDGTSKIGVDVMEIDRGMNKNIPEFFRIMRRQFTSDEWKLIRKDSDERLQLKRFYRHWCLKESFVKSLGVGITYDLQSISFEPKTELNFGNLVTDTQVRIDGSLTETWKFEESLIDENHIAVVAYQCQNDGRKLSTFKTLKFKDLILNSCQIGSLETELAEEFMRKPESPCSLR